MTISNPGEAVIEPRLAMSPRKRSAVIAVVALVLGLLSAWLPAMASPAHAAPGDPFNPDAPSVYIAQNSPTQLSIARTNGSGETTFTAEGPVASITYNAIAYRTADNYVYAIATPGDASIPTGSLIRIGQGGVITRVGTTIFTAAVVGTFGPADGYYYTYANVAGVLSLQVIDVATATLVRTTPITGSTIVGADFAFSEGFLWTASGTTISRTDPVTGATTQFPNAFAAGEAPTDVAGAAWTYGNGNLGFSYNTSGNVYQINVSDPGSATPTFELVSTNPGPPSGNNDGTASPGLPTDLSIVKEGPVALIPGGTVTYTITVTNNGPGTSSGFVVNDSVPAALTNVTSTDDACTVTANDVRCVGGGLAMGASQSFEVTASVPAGITDVVENTATVTSNENDPDLGNNTSTTEASPAGVSLVKRAGTPVDVNANGITDAGDTIQYEFDVTNDGTVELTDIAVSDPLAGAVTCPDGPLAVDATVTCAADDVYTVTAADVTAGAVNNTATVSGTTPDGEAITSAPSTTSTPTTASAPAISVVKSADPSQGDFEAGDVITYNFVVTNTGNVPLSEITIAEGAFTGTGEISEPVCEETTLAVGAQTVCTATYTMTTADVDAGSVTNTATATGTPPGESPVTSEPSTVTVPTPPQPSLTVEKTADVEAVVEAGQTVTYSFLVTNTGNVTLSNVGVVEGEFSGSGELSAVECEITTLLAGQFQVCTATYTVTQADVDAGGELTNVATAQGTPPGGGDPVPSEPSGSSVPVDQAPELEVVKTADVQAAEVGQVITYSFVVTNTGNVTITDPTIDEVEFSGTGELSAITCPEDGVLAPGSELTCTATYTVTQADIDAGELSNTATVTGTTPGGDPTDPSEPSTAIVTTDPLPALSLVKTADVTEISRAGEVVTYSFVVTNTGNVTISAPTVTEGEFTGKGELSAVTCPEDTVLEPGESVTCTATYTVVAADLAGGTLRNTATVSGTTPDGEITTSVPSTAEIDTPADVPGGGSPDDGDDLAVTGADLLPVGMVGLALLLLGGVVAAGTRIQRRRSTS